MPPMSAGDGHSTVRARRDGLEVLVRPRAVLEQVRTVGVGLREEALELVGAIGDQVVVVVGQRVRPVVVEDLLHLLDDLGALGDVGLGALGRIELVVLGVAVEGIGEAGQHAAAVLVGPAVAGHRGQLVVRVGLDDPSPLEHVVLALADLLGEGVLRDERDVRRDTDVGEVALDVLDGLLRRRGVRPAEEPEVQPCAVLCAADAVRTDAVARGVEQRPGLVRVVGDLVGRVRCKLSYIGAMMVVPALPCPPRTLSTRVFRSSDQPIASRRRLSFSSGLPSPIGLPSTSAAPVLKASSLNPG